MNELLKEDSKVRFSKFVVFYCLILGPIFTSVVLFFNWCGIQVQVEIILFFGTVFLGHLFSLAWVTVVKSRCECNEQEGSHEGR